MALETADFHLITDALCLNFANSKSWNDHENFNFFKEYQYLLPWALQMDLMTLPQAEQKLALAAQQPQQAQAALKYADRVRETIYHIFFAIANQQEIPVADLAYFNEAWRAALAHLQIVPGQDSLHWDWVDADGELDSLLWPILHSAAELLISEKLIRVKSCNSCGWLFLDSTKAGRRRWCDMKLCGNRAKARRHYARSKADVA